MTGNWLTWRALRWVKFLGVAGMLAGCASTGIVAMDKGVYLIAKKSPQVGFGPPIGIKGDAYTEANAFCAKDGKTVETVKLDETNAGFGRPAAVSLEFRCR
jgi:hypothetical protein